MGPLRIIGMNPIDKRVLLVAVGSPDRRWCAFIGAVKGEDYGREAIGVVESGSVIPYELAELCFEDLGKGTIRGDLKWQSDLGSGDSGGHRASTGGGC
jgi:hypothetical protein